MTGKTNAGSGAQVFYLGTGTSFDVSNVPGYQNLTKDNFLPVVNSLYSGGTGYFNWSEDANVNSSSSNVSVSYDATTGKATVNGTTYTGTVNRRGVSSSELTFGNGCSVCMYLVIGKIKTL